MWDSNPRFLCKDFALKAKALPLGQSGTFEYITFAFSVTKLYV